MGATSTVVIGGGVAGITAALDCADAGASVTLVEVRPRLGGAAYSFGRDGGQFDNGQHVFLRCCTSYRALLARLGSEDRVRLQARMRIPVLSPGAPPAELKSAPLPPPVHLARSLLRYPLLSFRERVRAALAARALAHVDPDDHAADARSFGDWLAEHGQDARAIERLWDLVALPTLNVRAREASLALAAFVFQTGLLSDASAADIGFHVRPLSEIIGAPALHALQESGVEVLLSTRAVRVEAREASLRVALAERGELEASTVIVALPHTRVADVLPASLDPLAGRVRALESSPIVNVHVVYDRPVCAWPLTDVGFAAGVCTPVQYVFDRSESLGLPSGRYLAVSLSGAEQEMQMSSEELRERYTRALGELLPAARAARIERFQITREHAATFRAAPGTRSLRPSSETPVPGLLLAGAFTDTGWPATLEGAVRSGHAAARAALRRLGIDRGATLAAASPAGRENGGSAVGALA